MAEMIRFYKGSLESLPNIGVDGAIYVTTDEGCMYLGTGTGMKRLGDFIQVDAVANLPLSGAYISALYYCVAENVLAKWNGSTWIQINKQKSKEELIELLGLQDIDDVIAKKHEHTNQAVLDNIAIENIVAWNGAERNIIDSVDSAQFIIDENRNLTLLDVAMTKVSGLIEALDDKVTKVAGSRLLTETEAEKLEKLVIGENGSVEVSGIIAAGNVSGLDEWITARASILKGLSENNLTDALIAKLQSIDDNAQTNTIEVININNQPLIISNKTINIPLATLQQSGVVISSSEENKVKVGDDGTMEVNSVNINKLVQNEGDTLILNGGAS